MVASGDEITAADLTGLEDLTIRAPIGRLVQTVAQTGIASNTTTAVTFTTEDLDPDGLHDTGSNTSRVTPTVAGHYRVCGSVSIAGAADHTIIEAFIRRSGSTGIAPSFRLAATFGNQTLVFGTTALVECNGTTDYFEICLRVTKTAGTVATVISSQFASVLEWKLERPA